MSTLISIGYPDAATAAAAADEAQRRATELHVQPDAVAAIRRDREGQFHVTTNHRSDPNGESWGMFWGLLFGATFFVPATGMTVGSDLGALIGQVESSGLDQHFLAEVRDLLQPGASALFLVVDGAAPETAIDALSYGGTALRTSMSPHTESALNKTLHGAAQPASKTH